MYFIVALRTFGFSDDWIFVLLFWCAHNITYYAWALPCQWFYKHDYLQQWKIEPLKKPDATLIASSSIKQIWLRCLLHPFIWFFMYRTIISKQLDCEIPSLYVSIILLLISFYSFFLQNAFLHKAFHDYPFLFRWHKLHHQFITTTGIAAEHHTLIDSIANGIITLLPCIILQLHPILWCIHMFLRTWESVDSHSGYAFPFTPFQYLPGFAHQQEYHAFHHYAYQGAFSCLLFDHLTGADKPYLKKIQRSFISVVSYGYFGK